MASLFNKLGHLTKEQILYPLITLCYGVLVVVVFYTMVSSLYETLNRPFQLSDASLEAALPQINLAQYELIVNKLNLSAQINESVSTSTEAVSQ
jgi:hypothetical protein